MADRRERAFDDIGRAQMLPVLGREIVEGEQRLAILDQALDRRRLRTEDLTTSPHE